LNNILAGLLLQSGNLIDKVANPGRLGRRRRHNGLLKLVHAIRKGIAGTRWPRRHRCYVNRNCDHLNRRSLSNKRQNKHQTPARIGAVAMRTTVS
jgi:hypothetical protein